MYTMDSNQYGSNMLAYPDPAHFDYAAFLSESSPYQNLSPLPHTLPSSSEQNSTSPISTSKSSHGDSSASSSSGALTRKAQAQKQRLERRGHTKSRRGCYNCKRRRIKCQETRPACGHCVKTGLDCEYPIEPQITHQPHHQIPLFSLQDMRFFQYFLTQCYPSHPLKQEEVWTHEIPCIAQSHDFLMHSILGYSASELIQTDPSLANAALTHRVKAIRSIKKRLSESGRGEMTYEESNAMVASCFALTFQSTKLDDGLAEYMTFIRGIAIVAMQMGFRGIKPVFPTLFEDNQNEILQPYMEDLPLIQRGLADAAAASIQGLRPLCTTPLELEYLQKLQEIVEQLYINSFEAYKTNSRQYGWWMLLPHDVFQELLDMDNQVMLLLHSHWIALSQIMAFINEQEQSAREKRPTKEDGPRDPGFIRWLKYLNARVDYNNSRYNQWPQWVDAQLDKDITIFGRRE